MPSLVWTRLSLSDGPSKRRLRPTAYWTYSVRVRHGVGMEYDPGYTMRGLGSDAYASGSCSDGIPFQIMPDAINIAIRDAISSHAHTHPGSSAQYRLADLTKKQLIHSARLEAD